MLWCEKISLGTNPSFSAAENHENTVQHLHSTCSPYSCCTSSSSELTPPLNIIFYLDTRKKITLLLNYLPAFSCEDFSAHIHTQQERTGQLYYSIIQERLWARCFGGFFFFFFGLLHLGSHRISSWLHWGAAGAKQSC